MPLRMTIIGHRQMSPLAPEVWSGSLADMATSPRDVCLTPITDIGQRFVTRLGPALSDRGRNYPASHLCYN
jgi:hypothetical protein